MLMKLAKVHSRALEQAAACEVSGSLSFMSITAKSPLSQGWWQALCRWHLNLHSASLENLISDAAGTQNQAVCVGSTPITSCYPPKNGAEISNPPPSSTAQACSHQVIVFFVLFFPKFCNYLETHTQATFPVAEVGNEIEAQSSAVKWEDETPTRNSRPKPLGAHRKPGCQ